MRDLHEELTALSVEWPATPDIAGVVAERLAAPAAPRRRGRRFAWRPALAYSLAAIAAAFALTMAVSPDARSSVLEWLGLKSVEIERGEPTAPPPRPGPLGEELELGTLMPLAEARERSDLLRLPRADGLGEPDAIYVGDDRVSLVYGERPGYAQANVIGAALLVQEFRARVGPFIQKTIGQASELERLRIDGDPAYFIRGAHGFAYDPGSTDVRFEEQRLAGNTLLVERDDGLLIRIEGEIDRDQAVAVARSIP
jgi:hypothetical protein